jgi:branched-subunit amino acid ABC-type transport system permease component
MTIRCLVLAVAGGTLSPWTVLLAGVGMGVGESWIAYWAGAQWSPLLGYAWLLAALHLRAHRRAAAS